MKGRFNSRNTVRRWRAIGQGAGLVALLSACYLLVLNLPTRVYEAGDFLGYWTAANLLAHRQSPYDPEAMLALERQQGWQGDDPVYSWNPPWLHVLLIPLGVLPFRPAAALWFMVNPLLIGASVLLMWDTISARGEHRHAALPLLAAFLFSRSLHAVLEGQVNTLVLLGCACFLALTSRRRDSLAGAALVLVTVKPHVAYLLLPSVLMLVLLQRRWRVIVGFLASLAFLLFLASCLYPQWLETYSRLFDVPASPLLSTQYATPTVRGLVWTCLGLDIGPRLSVICLAAFLVLIWSRRRDLTLPVMASLSLIVGLPTSTFGWSTDQVVLLIPIVQALSWTRNLTSKGRWIAALSLLLTYTYAVCAWLVSYRDIAFLAVPPMVGLFWGYVYWAALPGARRTDKMTLGDQQARDLQQPQNGETFKSAAAGGSVVP
jgi:hypothetical protein